MQIVNVAISNYRNLDGVEISFNPTTNFVIGENDLGKSNLLQLFDTLFNRRQFSDDDFTKQNIPIKVEISLRLSKAEKGVFEDYFEPDENDIIAVTGLQEYSSLEEDITFFWREPADGFEIPPLLFRRVNYIGYDSLGVPQNELTFYKGRGGGKFLRYLINEFVASDVPLDIDASIAPVIEAIQSIFDRLRPLKQQGLGLHTNQENPSDFVSRVLKLNGLDGFDIQKSGYGIQFSTLLLLSIFERLMYLKQNKYFRQFEAKRDYFTQQEYQVFMEMYVDSLSTIEPILGPITQEQDGNYYVNIGSLSDADKQKLGHEILEHIRTRKSVSMILGLDEPEIHFHPYMQRSLVKYICGLLQNQEPDFLFLLKSFFDIDMLDGQVHIVSHSPVVLLDEYKQIVRFHRSDKVNVVSGYDLALDSNTEKHLLLNFPEVKEALFSRCTIVVEGETESGALPIWANKIIGDLDEYGITIICVGGVASVPPVVTLLNHFGIPNVSIIDKDSNNDADPEYSAVDGLRTTLYRDFEEEIFETVRLHDAKVTALFNFLESYSHRGLESFCKKDRLSSIASKYHIDQTWDSTIERYTFEEAKDSDNINLIKAMFLSWMAGGKTGKSIMLGRALGQFIDKEYIPASYKQLCEDAKAKVV